MNGGDVFDNVILLIFGVVNLCFVFGVMICMFDGLCWVEILIVGDKVCIVSGGVVMLCWVGLCWMEVDVL